MRLTVAIEPALPVAERLVLLQEDLADPLHHLTADAAWVPAESLRLVLDTRPMDEGALAFARTAVHDACRLAAPFEMQVVGASFVPTPEQPRLVAVTVVATDALTALQARIEEALRPVSPPPTEVPWRPMISLGRLKTDDRTLPLGGVLRPYSETEFGITQVHDLVLSVTETRRGKVYSRQLDRLSLSGDS